MSASRERRLLWPVAMLLMGAALGLASPSALAAVIPTHIVPCGIQSPLPTGDPRSQPCTLCHMGIGVMNLTNYAIYVIALPVIALLVAVGGIILLTGGPSEERIKLGKRILINAIVGAVIVFLAWITVDTIIKILTGVLPFGGPSPGELSKQWGPWNQLDPTNCPL